MSDSLRGKFLIAGRSLRDPNFFQSVVLIVEHGQSGAMGLIVNRPSGFTVAKALKENFELPETGEMVYVGGPVERNSLFILHNMDDLDADESAVVDGVFLGSSPATFESVVRRAAESDPDLKFRVYFGCAGWAPEQLEGELARNDWLVHPAAMNFVYDRDPYNLWSTIVQEFHKANPILPGIDGNPELN